MVGPAPLSTRRQLVLNALWFGLNLQTAALLPVVVPTQVLLIVAPGTAGSAAQAVFLGWLAAGAAAVAVVAQPLVGALSDRTRSRFGRRRPHVVWGTAVALAGATGLALAAGPWAFALAFLVLQAGNSAATAAYQALLPDLVPAERRGAASGVLGLMTILGNAASLGAAALLLGGAAGPRAIASGAGDFYALTAVGLAVSCAVSVVGVREPAGEPSAARTTPADWARPWRSRSFRWVFVARFLVISGLTLFLTFIEYYFARVAHEADFIGATAAVALVALLVAVAGAVALGPISDRMRRVPLTCASTLVMGLAAVLFLAGAGRVPLWALGAAFGLGYGAYWSVDWALAVDSLPSAGAAGRELGLWSLASSLPAVAAPALGGAIVGAGAALGHTEAGYQGVFVAAALCFLLGAAAVLGVREQRPLVSVPDRSYDRRNGRE